LRAAVNDKPDLLNARVAEALGWGKSESIRWLSPVRDDDYAEYYDQEFLNRLGLTQLPTPLASFWPASGPRWDALATTDTGRVLLVEAKAYIEESVDFVSRASNPTSLSRIGESLEKAKNWFRARPEAPWASPFYQTANRLAHLYFLHKENALDAWLLFLYFANAPDVPDPCTVEQWEGAVRLTKKCLGLSEDLSKHHVGDLIWDCAVSELSLDSRS